MANKPRDGDGITPTVYDAEDGVDLMFEFDNGLVLGVYMSDEAAQELIDIIQNKLNARMK